MRSAPRRFLGHGGGVMRRIIVQAVGMALAIAPAVAIAQSPKAATYITDEEVKKVNAEPGVDRTIRVVDIGSENLAVGIIHRSPTSGGTMGGGAPAGGGRAAGVEGEACGERPATGSTTSQPSGLPTGITHDSQTESYVIV